MVGEFVGRLLRPQMTRDERFLAAVAAAFMVVGFVGKSFVVVCFVGTRCQALCDKGCGAFCAVMVGKFVGWQSFMVGRFVGCGG